MKESFFNGLQKRYTTARVENRTATEDSLSAPIFDLLREYGLIIGTFMAERYLVKEYINAMGYSDKNGFVKSSCIRGMAEVYSPTVLLSGGVEILLVSFLKPKWYSARDWNK
jgi:hypothetical protein